MIRAVVEELAALERLAGSPGERRAAQLLAARLDAARAPAVVEEVPFHDGFAQVLAPLGAAGVAAGLVALTGGPRRRRGAALVAALAAAALADDVDNRARVWRRLVTRPKVTTNVVAQAGDPAATRTVVLLAHHDAARTGWAFDQSGQRALARYLPGVLARIDTSLPLWWPVVGAPAAVAAGALARRRRLIAAGIAGSALSTVLALDIARSPIVPGANDNLSGVAVLVGLAERLAAEPVAGLRVVLASCGAEEVLQGGIYAFADRHLRGCDPAATWVLNLDTVGSPRLVLVEGEGTFRVADYADPGWRDLIADVARERGITLVRGMRSHLSTDAVIPSRLGLPTALVTSFEPETKLLSNYHLMTDTPANLDLGTVGEALDLAEAVVRRLARR